MSNELINHLLDLMTQPTQLDAHTSTDVGQNDDSDVEDTHSVFPIPDELFDDALSSISAP